MNEAAANNDTDGFARFVEELTFEKIPSNVITRTKEVLYDGIGALLAATSSRFDIGGVISRFVSETGGIPEAQVFGLPQRTNCATAALVNGTLGYYCDIESHHAGAIMHAIAVVGPAALAVGERQHSSGRDLLTAIVAGIDVCCRVSYALSAPALYARGFHPTCVAGTFGSMAAAGRLFGLQGRTLRNAFGLAGTETSGLLAWVSDPTEHSRPFNMGLASRHGVLAAHLASCGFGGPPTIFEGKYPLGQAFTGEWHRAELFATLGTHFRVMELYFKQYACCAFIHPGLDGLMDIRKAEQLSSDDIASITLRFPKSGYKVIDNNALRSHCAQYVLALAAEKGAVHFYDILHDQRDNPKIRSLSQHIEVIGDADLDRTYPDLYRSIIEVKLHSGVVHVRDVIHPRGSPEQPLTKNELHQKFLMLTKDVIQPIQAEAIAGMIDRLETLADIGSLTALLKGQSRDVAAAN